MGLGGISIWQLVIILVIVVLVFGTKRLKGLGSARGIGKSAGLWAACGLSSAQVLRIKGLAGFRETLA
ncbi:MAG: twin-arginine translocase TatA/TatE family subunit [Chromatiaceae bacterium]